MKMDNTEHAYTKGDLVTYTASELVHGVLAIVHQVHRDGYYTVEARFLLNESGETEGTYLGYKYRINGSDLTPAGAST